MPIVKLAYIAVLFANYLEVFTMQTIKQMNNIVVDSVVIGIVVSVVL